MESRGVKKMCRWHIFSQDRSGYAARREVIKTDLSPSLETPLSTEKETALRHIINFQYLVCIPRFSLRTLLRHSACSASPELHLVQLWKGWASSICGGSQSTKGKAFDQGKKGT